MAALSTRAWPAPRSRMCGVVDAGQMRKVEMGVDLRAADVGMTQQFLHTAQIRTGLEQVSCKRMTKHMRVYMQRQALAARPGVNPQLHGSNRQLAAASAHEQGAGGRAGAPR